MLHDIIKKILNAPVYDVAIQTPLDLAAVLDFYRTKLNRRGWTEQDGAAIAPDRAVITFTTPSGPALLRLTRQHDRTIVDLSRHKPVSPDETALANSSMLPQPAR